MGFAELRSQDTLQELIQRGDAALYEAKRARWRLRVGAWDLAAAGQPSRSIGAGRAIQ
jgi:GGDEF domain-containing protein